MKQPPKLPHHTRLAVAAVGLVVMVAPGLVVAPGRAEAHAILVESQPPIGGAVPAGHVAFRLRYNSRIDHERSRLTLTLPDKSRDVLPTSAADNVDILSTAADLAPGEYTLRWQVLAIDGHITRGDVPFKVVPPAGATQAGATKAGATQAATPAPGSQSAADH